MGLKGHSCDYCGLCAVCSLSALTSQHHHVQIRPSMAEQLWAATCDSAGVAAGKSVQACALPACICSCCHHVRPAFLTLQASQDRTQQEWLAAANAAGLADAAAYLAAVPRVPVPGQRNILVG